MQFPTETMEIPGGTLRKTFLPPLNKYVCIAGKFKFKIWRQDSEERAWWMDDDKKEGKRKSSSKSGRGSSRESSKSKSGDKLNHLRHQKSGERAWWMSDDPHNIPDGVVVIPVSPKTESYDQDSFPKTIGRIRHVESGERAWWMDSNSNIPDDIIKISTETSNSDSSGSYDRIDIGIKPEEHKKPSLPKFPIEFPPPPPPDEALGDRVSPEGVN